MGFPHWYITNTRWTPWWMVERKASEKYTASMASSKKKKQKKKNETCQNQTENEAADFPRFIVIEFLVVCQAKFSFFHIEKIISTRATPKTIKKNQERKLASQGGQTEAGRKYIKNENFSYDEMQSILRGKFNTSKGVIRSRELAFSTEEEIASALGKLSYKYKKNLH